MMKLQKLSTNVNKKATSLIKRIISVLCILAGIVVLGIVTFFTVQDNTKQVRLYSARIDNTMSEKMAFINTVAAGASSGVAQSDYYAYVDMMAEQYEDVSAVYLCVKEKDVVYQDGVMTYMSGGWVPDDDFVVTERSWYTGALNTEGIYVSEPYVDVQTGNICITLAKKVYNGTDVIGVAGLDMYMDDLVSLIEDSYDEGDYVFLTSEEGTILTHPNNKIALTAESSTTVSDALGGKYKSVCSKPLQTKLIWDYSGGLKFAISNVSEVTGWNVVAVISITWVIIVMVAVIVLAVVLGILIGKLASRRLLARINPMFVPLEELALNVGKITDGELDYYFEVDEQSIEVNALSAALNETMKGLRNCISEISNTVTAISEKNLDFKVDGEYAGDYEKIKNSLIDIKKVLNDCFMQMNEQASTVLHYSRELSNTSESVAESSTVQSESVMKASEEMKKLTDNMEKITGFAVAIKGNIDNTNTSLTTGNEEMKELVEAMDEISKCYDEIAGFVTEISAIADQTNLLALNASIEAARAGELGKGFAVVADEISALSSSSSESSEKINHAIQNSLESVKKGKNLVVTTGKSISDSVDYSTENTRMVKEIVNYIKTQNQSADEISESLRSISEIVENNAASAEENSAISIQLGECAQSLMDTIAQFKLQE